MSKQGIDWTNAPWSSPHTTTFNSRVHPASSIGASATHCGPTSFSGLHNVAPASSNPTQKSHGDHFTCVDDVGCFQNTPRHLLSATTASTISPMVQFNMEDSQPIWHCTLLSLPPGLLHSSSTAPYPMGLTFPKTVEFRSIPPLPRIYYHPVVSYPPTNNHQLHWTTIRLPTPHLGSRISRNLTNHLLLPQTLPGILNYKYRKQGERGLLMTYLPRQAIVGLRLPDSVLIGAHKKSVLLSILSQTLKNSNTGARREGRRSRRYFS